MILGVGSGWAILGRYAITENSSSRASSHDHHVLGHRTSASAVHQKVKLGSATQLLVLPNSISDPLKGWQQLRLAKAEVKKVQVVLNVVRQLLRRGFSSVLASKIG